MGMRLFNWSPEDLYRFFNSAHPDWPNVPPPPNPTGFQAFILACIDETIQQQNEENSSDAGSSPRQGRRQV